MENKKTHKCLGCGKVYAHRPGLSKHKNSSKDEKCKERGKQGKKTSLVAETLGKTKMQTIRKRDERA